MIIELIGRAVLQNWFVRYSTCTVYLTNISSSGLDILYIADDPRKWSIDCAVNQTSTPRAWSWSVLHAGSGEHAECMRSEAMTLVSKVNPGMQKTNTQHHIIPPEMCLSVLSII